MNRPELAPGCFGSAFSYGEDEICCSCVFAAQCFPMHQVALEELQNMYGVKAPTRKKSEIAVKSLKIFESLGKTQGEVREAMMAGVNPYDKNSSTTGLVCQLLLNAKELTRSIMEKVVARRQNINETTASVYVRQALQILTYCDAVEIDGKVIRLPHVEQSK